MIAAMTANNSADIGMTRSRSVLDGAITNKAMTDSLHDPLAAGGHREFCVALVTCLWTSFANCWNGMCVPI
jgi:hypothetical protein